MACSITSVSTQPPLIEPTTSPCAVTAILAPAGRGVEPAVVKTVATATGSPRPRHSSTRFNISRMGTSSLPTLYIIQRAAADGWPDCSPAGPSTPGPAARPGTPGWPGYAPAGT